MSNTPVMDSPEVLGHALCRHVPDMRKGFTIQTRHGDIYVTADDAAPFSDVMERLLMSKIRQIQGVDDTPSITLPELTHNQTASIINFLMEITSVDGKQVMGVSEAFYALREYGLKPHFSWPRRFTQKTVYVESPEQEKQLYQAFHAINSIELGERFSLPNFKGCVERAHQNAKAQKTPAPEADK